MAEAQSLFSRHLKVFEKIINGEANNDQRARLYAACILAEAIRNDWDDAGIRMPMQSFPAIKLEAS